MGGVALSGCLGERIEASGDRTIHVQAGTSASEFRFEPATIRVQPGETVNVLVHNNGTERHAFTNHDFHLHSGSLVPGASATIPFTARQPGSFEIACDEAGHGKAGMKDTIEVPR